MIVYVNDRDMESRIGIYIVEDEAYSERVDYYSLQIFSMHVYVFGNMIWAGRRASASILMN